MIHRGAGDRRGRGIAAASFMGSDGQERGLWGDLAGLRHRALDGFPGRNDHDVYAGRSALRLSGFPKDPSLHTGDLPAPLRDHGVGGVADLGHQHQPCPQPGTGNRLGTIFSGFIGLFTGAIVLSVGYNLMVHWIGEGKH